MERNSTPVPNGGSGTREKLFTIILAIAGFLCILFVNVAAERVKTLESRLDSQTARIQANEVQAAKFAGEIRTEFENTRMVLNDLKVAVKELAAKKK